MAIQPSGHRNIPNTISKEAQKFLKLMPEPDEQPPFPEPDDIEAWKTIQQEAEVYTVEYQKRLINRFKPQITNRVLGTVPVLDIKPDNWKNDGKAVIYTHGGAYVLLSAASTLTSSILVAAATGKHVISIDYTLSPHQKWHRTINQVASVFRELKKQRYEMSDLAFFGDSAGGGLAVGTVLKMRDDGMGMPAAVVLWSPWVDITHSGDSYVTLKNAELLCSYEKHLKFAAKAYAEVEDQTNPYVSPVYGDYTLGFPPTLIQGGTKEILLSNFVRLYQALDTAGQTVKLDLYEGMPHAFQALMPNIPETKLALRKVDAFLADHLVKDVGRYT